MISVLDLRELYFDENYSYLEDYATKDIEPSIKLAAYQQEETIKIPLCELNSSFNVKSIVQYFQHLGYNAFISNCNELVINWSNND